MVGCAGRSLADKHQGFRGRNDIMASLSCFIQKGWSVKKRGCRFMAASVMLFLVRLHHSTHASSHSGICHSWFLFFDFHNHCFGCKHHAGNRSCVFKGNA